MDDKEIIGKIWNCYNYPKECDEDIEGLYAQIQDPDIIHHDSSPVLHFAASYADVKGIKKLLELGADAEAPGSLDRTPLHALAYGTTGNYKPPEGAIKDAALALLDAGVSPLRKNSDGYTCAYVAAEKGNHELIEALIEAGRKMDLTNNNGDTPLHAACKYAKHVDESFYKYTEPKHLELMKRTAGYEAEEKILSEQKKSSQEQYDREKSKMDAYFHVVKALCDSGSDPERKNNYGVTAKELGFECKDLRISAVLNGTYSDGMDTSDAQIRTKGMDLPQALAKNDRDALTAILETGADPNVLCSEKLDRFGTRLEGMYPLGIACAFLDEESISLLLNSGADPNAKDTFGNSPAFYCAGAPAGSNKLSDKVPEKVLEMLLKSGLDMDASVDSKENTLLNLCCKRVESVMSYNGETLPGRIIQFLLRKKADVNKSNIEGVTPLMNACSGSRTEDLQISLLEKGADIAAKDKNGSTPLIHSAKNRNKSMGKAMAEMLFEFGDPDTEAVDNGGKNALQTATDEDNEELVKFLLGKM